MRHLLSVIAFIKCWADFWSRPATTTQPPADTSYDEVAPEQIRRMNEHAKSDYTKGNWVTEKLEA